MPNIGDKALTFTLPSSAETDFDLAKNIGKNVVLFFYPKDDTPGCTKEAIAFGEHLDAFDAANTTIVGISKDTLAKHDKFICKHDLRVELLSDADGNVCELYETWREKKMYGKVFWGIERSTFLIDAEGNLAAEWRKVKVPGHVEAVLEAAQGLAK